MLIVRDHCRRLGSRGRGDLRGAAQRHRDVQPRQHPHPARRRSVLRWFVVTPDMHRAPLVEDDETNPTSVSAHPAGTGCSAPTGQPRRDMPVMTIGIHGHEIRARSRAPDGAAAVAFRGSSTAMRSIAASTVSTPRDESDRRALVVRSGPAWPSSPPHGRSGVTRCRGPCRPGWKAQGAAGPVIFIAIYAAATVLFPPGVVVMLPAAPCSAPCGHAGNLSGATLGATPSPDRPPPAQTGGGAGPRLVQPQRRRVGRRLAFHRLVRLVPPFPFNLSEPRLGPHAHSVVGPRAGQCHLHVPGRGGVTWLGYAGREALTGGQTSCATS